MAGSSGSTYVRGRVKPKSTGRHDAVASPVKPRSATRRDAVTPPREQAAEPEGIPRPKIATDVRLRPDPGSVPPGEGLGVALLTMLVGGVMLLVGGVLAFLIFAPAPNAAQPEPPVAGIGGEPAALPFRLPGGNKELFTLEGNRGPVTAVAFITGGRQVASSSADGTVRVWDLEKRAAVHNIKVSAVGATAVAFTNDSRLFAAGAADGGAVLYDLENKRALYWFPKEGKTTHQVAFTRDERKVLVASADGNVRSYEIASNAPVKTFKDPKSTRGGARALATRPGQLKEAVVGGEDGHVLLWDITAPKVLRPLRRPAAAKPAAKPADKAKDKPKDKAKAKPAPTRPAHSKACLAATYTPDGKRVLTAGADGLVCVWEVGGRYLFAFTNHKTPVHAVAASPDGQWAASVGDDLKLRVWSLGPQRNPREYAGPKDPLTAVAFSPDGRHVATGGQDGLVRIWAIDPTAP